MTTRQTERRFATTTLAVVLVAVAFVAWLFRLGQQYYAAIDAVCAKHAMVRESLYKTSVCVDSSGQIFSPAALK